MFEIITRQIRRRKKSERSTELPFNIETLETDTRSQQQIVETFIAKGSCQGKNLKQYSAKLLSLIAGEKEISQGAFFISDTKNGKPVIKYIAGYASPDPDKNSDVLELGEGFPGQVAKDGNLINISDIPQGYLSIESGLGKSSPASLLIFPVKSNDRVLAVIELASFHKFTHEDELFFKEISPAIAEQIQKSVSN